MKKLLILGLDGLNLQYLENLSINDTFKKICYGSLKSTIPPVTVPAWTCMGTGMKPENLGLTDFFRTGENYEKSSLDLEESFGDSHFFNFLENIKLFSNNTIGFGKLENSKNINKITTSTKKSWEERWPSRKLQRDEKNFLEGKKQLKNLLSDKEGVIFYFLHLTDGVIHWGEKGDMERIYRMVNEFLEEIIEECEREEWNLLVVSDHGARKVNRRFNINTWLEEKGYLNLKRKRNLSLKLMDLFSEKNLNFVRTLSNLTSRFSKIFNKDGVATGQGMILGDINWEDTKVFGVCTAVTNYMPLYINLEGKYEKGCVSQEEYDSLREGLKEKLLKVENAETGERVVEEVWFKEDIYDGEKMDAMPDLIVKSKGNYLIGHRPFPDVFSKRDRYIHDLYGTFMAHGPDFKEEYEVKGAEIVDVAPTILHLMGQKVPEDMDGKILKDIFKEDSEPAEREVEYYKPRDKEVKREELNEEEQRKVKERLKGLGYME